MSALVSEPLPADILRPNFALRDRSPTPSPASTLTPTGSRRTDSKIDILRDRVRRGDADELTGPELLHLLLSWLYPAEEAEFLSATLFRTFKSVGAVLAASPERIASVLPEAGDCGVLLQVTRRLVLSALREPFIEGPHLGNWAQVDDYLRLSLAHEEIETVRVLLLNAHNRLIKDELIASGWAAGVPFEPRKIAQRVLNNNACGLIIVHNHPSGDPTPSEEDAIVTRQLSGFLQAVKIRLFDHIIVGRRGCISMFKLGLI